MISSLVLDFESRSHCDLTKAGAYRYAADFSTEVLCLAYEEVNSGVRGVWAPGEERGALGFMMRNGKHRLVAHNVAFERAIWQHCMVPAGWPELPLERWACTQARANQLALPGGLDKLLKALGAPVQKDAEGSALVRSLSRVDKKTGDYKIKLTPEIIERVKAYCLNDITDEVWLWKTLGDLPPHERENWLVSQRMNDRGVGLDLELAVAMQRVVDVASAPLAARFAELTGGFSFTQIAKIKAWCHERGAPLPDLSKQTLEELLDEDEGDDAEEDDTGYGDAAADYRPAYELSHIVLPPDVEEALKIRQLVGSASIKKLKSMHACVGFDGRARGLMVYHGTGPGRQTAKLLQPHNFPRGSNAMQKHKPADKVAILKTGDAELVAMVLGPPVEVVVSSLRHCLQAAPGHVYASGDYSGIQARTVLALAGQHDKTALMAAGADVYIDMGCDIHRLWKPSWDDKEAIERFKKEHLKERQDGKNSVLGLGFGMQDETFQEKYGRDRPLSFCTRVVETYRKVWAPRVPYLWYGLSDAATNEVWYGGGHEAYGVLYERVKIGGIPFLRATIHNGTSIYYAYPEQTTTTYVSKKDGLVRERRAFTYWTYKAGRWQMVWPHGGGLTENVVMKIEREMMETAKRRLEAAGFPMVLEVHDEAIAEARDPDMDLYKRIMEDVEPWVLELGIPVQVDVWSGSRYKK